MTVRRRLLLVMVVTGLAGAVLVATGAIALLGRAVRARTVERITAETGLLASWVEATPADAQAFAARAAGRLGARVTLIARDGTVLGDSSRDSESLKAMDNHLDRPEVRGARLRGSASVLRRSSTTNVRYLYAAHRVAGDGAVGYVRLALPASEVEAVSPRHVWLVAEVVALAMLAVVALAYLAVRRLSRPMEKIAAAVERAAAGDLGAPVALPRDGGEEIGRLAASVRRLQAALVQKLAELDAERALLSSVVGGMREGLLLVDDERRVRLANQAVRAVLDLQLDPAGRKLEEVVRHPAVIRAIDAALQRDHEAHESVVRLPGSDRAFEVQATPLSTTADTGRSEALVLFFDVSRLERLEQVRRDFVANVSHELRTPLTSIKAFVENLLDGGLEDPANARRFVEILGRHADHMHELVEDLTDLSAIETGSVTLDPRPQDPRELLRGVLERLQPLASARGIEARVQLPAGFVVVADRRRLEQMLSNLVHNAIKFGREGGRVVIAGASDEAGTRVVVEDDGIGIPSDSLDKVFERFYQVNRDRSRAGGGGTGLGLSIVKHLMRLHGGRVTVASELGRGSRFALEFPPAAGRSG